MVNHRSKGTESPRRLSVILSCGFLLGCLLGAVWAACLDANQTDQLRNYLSEYFSAAQEPGVAAAFGTILWNQFRWHLYLVLFGLSVCGILWLPVLLGVRGFLLSFAVGSFLRIYGGAGIVSGLILFGLPSALWLPSMWMTASVIMEFYFLRSWAKSASGQSLPWIKRDVLAALGASFLLVLLCVFLEYWMLPRLVSVAARMIT